MGVSTLLALSILVNLVCWYWRKLAFALIFVECLWAIVDHLVLFSLHIAASSELLLNCTRFIAIGVLLGVDARLTILTATIMSLLTQIVTHTQTEALSLIISTLIVFSAVTAYWV